ncbi:MAG TPA: exodeoxyribonuclease VII large subunit [Alphaproteobacteria bacterium]|nr:exodeoxyribonuclease VII large subunit [Alphaproteobacteria bacterium]
MQYNNTYESNIKEYTVSELSNALKKTLEVNFDIVHLRGEISGLTIASSGHVYMSLKDDKNSLIDGIIWKGQAERISFKLEDGMEVLVVGRVSTYAPRSKYNIIINTIELAGEGALLKLIENRRRLLSEEGLFDEGHKKLLPFLPNTIGIITSDTGAAFKDIIIRIKKRFPVNVILYPVLVQGSEAPQQISDAIDKINMLPNMNNNMPLPDLLIVGRGGGSLEDLMAFNEEVVVRAIYNSKIPIISAVGHEVDNSLSDYAADVRAPTPTAAAEIALPDRKVLYDNLNITYSKLSSSIRNIISLCIREHEKCRLPMSHNILENKVQNLDIIIDQLYYKIKTFIDSNKNKLNFNKIELYSPAKYCENQLMNLSSEIRLLKAAYKNLVNQKQHSYSEKPKILNEKFDRLINNMRMSFIKVSGAIEALSYNRILERGFALIKNENNQSITRAKDIVKDTNAIIHLYDGKIKAKLSNNDN